MKNTNYYDPLSFLKKQSLLFRGKLNTKTWPILLGSLLLVSIVQKSFSQASNFGVNLAGLEFGGTPSANYVIPTAAELDYYNGKGIKLIRLPFMWERAQPTLGGALNTAYVANIDQIIASAKTRGMSIILDVHNYCRYNGNVIGASGSPVTIAHFSDLWKKLAARYVNEPTVYAYDLMNEPSEMPTSNLWFNIAQAAINSIRTVDNNHIIMVEGDFWAHADMWLDYSDNLKNLTDPANKIVYQAHQYFDSNGSGNYGSNTVSGNGMNSNSGVTKMSVFVNWLKTNNKKGFVGEYGVPNNADVANWNLLIDNMLKYLSDNCVGGTYWSGGPGWGNYILSCEPSPLSNPDRPIMPTLMKYTKLASGCGTTPPVNQVPSVNLTSPVNGTSYNAPASIVIAANASDADGSVTKVEFYNGSTLLNSDATAPYSFTWSNVPAGTYNLSAKAYDNQNAVTTSTVVSIAVKSVTVNQAPSISITSPLSGTGFTSPASILINANATDADGTISKVEFYNGTALLNSDVSAPYSITWSNVMEGTYSISAKAYDNSGAVTTSTAVSITVSSSGTCLAPQYVEKGGYVAGSKVKNGGKLYECRQWPASGWCNEVAWAYAPGTGTVWQDAWIDLGSCNGTTNQVPSVGLTSPTNGSSFTAPTSITINATASDADGSITKVDFYNGTTLLNSDNTAPFSFVWSNVPAGNYTITAKATDNAGATTTSTAVTISVTTVVVNQAPVISITSPTNGASLTAPASITINANASDTDGTVSKVEFYNGATLLNTDITAPYSFVWGNVAAGNYTITAKATDNAGATASSSVTISVTTVTVNQAPTATITSPSNGASYSAPASFTINASATDTDGTISKVDFYNGTTLLGSDATAPYTWNISNAAAGTYNYKAIATDNAGATGTSATVSVTVNGTISTIGINGPTCASPNTATTFTLNPDAGYSSATWWVSAEATITVDATGKQATITFTSNAVGTVTVSCGTNFSSAPWYKEYTKTIQVGSCATAARTSAPEVVVSAQPFVNETSVSLKNGEKILSAKLFDIKGSEIFHKENINSDELTVGGNLKAGIYFLTIVTENGTYNKRIVKSE